MLDVHVIRLPPLPSLILTSSLCDCCCFFHSLIFMPGSVCIGFVCWYWKGTSTRPQFCSALAADARGGKCFPSEIENCQCWSPSPLLTDCFPTFKCILQTLLLSPLCKFLIQTPLRVPLYAISSSSGLSLFNSFFYQLPFSLQCFRLHTVVVQGAYLDVDCDPERVKAVKKKSE